MKTHKIFFVKKSMKNIMVEKKLYTQEIHFPKYAAYTNDGYKACIVLRALATHGEFSAIFTM